MSNAEVVIAVKQHGPESQIAVLGDLPYLLISLPKEGNEGVWGPEENEKISQLHFNLELGGGATLDNRAAVASVLRLIAATLEDGTVPNA